MLVSLCKECVAGGPETLPEHFGLLAGHSADFLPLVLEIDQPVCGLLPFRAVLQALCLLDDGHLLLQVGVHAVLELHIELALAGKELVAGGAEAVINLLVLLLGCEPYGLPLLLNLLYGL